MKKKILSMFGSTNGDLLRKETHIYFQLFLNVYFFLQFPGE